MIRDIKLQRRCFYRLMAPTEIGSVERTYSREIFVSAISGLSAGLEYVHNSANLACDNSFNNLGLRGDDVRKWYCVPYSPVLCIAIGGPNCPALDFNGDQRMQRCPHLRPKQLLDRRPCRLFLSRDLRSGSL